MKISNDSRLVYFGCSLTSGHELIDHELLGISFRECNDIKAKYKSIKLFYDYLHTTCNIDNLEYNTLSVKKSYAGKLSAMLGLEYINFAYPGRSLDQNILDLYHQFHLGRLNPEKDIIFLGVPSPIRFVKFDHKGNPISVVLNIQYEEVDENLVTYYNGYKMMQNYFFGIEAFKNFCIQKGFKFFIQPTQNIKTMTKVRDNQSRDFFYDVSSDWLYLRTFDRMLDEVANYAADPKIWLTSRYDHRKYGYCGFKHPTEVAHQYFAEDLFKAISKNLEK